MSGEGTFSIYEDKCTLMYRSYRTHFDRIAAAHCESPFCNALLCQKKVLQKKSARGPADLPELNNSAQSVSQRHRTFVKCPANHVVHDFLSCDAESYCEGDQFPARCDLLVVSAAANQDMLFHTERNSSKPRDSHLKDKTFVEMYKCLEYGGTIPYTLVCDFRKDCIDNSDEKYCRHNEDMTKYR